MGSRRRSDVANTEADEYVVRPYEARDAAAVAALYRRIWGTDVSPAWVDHHVSTPYLDGPALVVAAADGSVVGARPFVPFPVRGGGADAVGLHLSDLMVHPEHRRNGLFTRMTERVVDAHADDAAFTLNFGNAKSAPGYRKMGFTEVGAGPERYLRVQRPGRFVRERLGPRVGGLAAPLADRAIAGYHRVRALARPATGGYRVASRDGLPADLLADLYERDPPARLHLRREPALYRWLDGHPGWEHETYVARDGDGPAAALVVQRRAESDPETRWLFDAVPLPDGNEHTGAFTALLAAAVDAHADAAVLIVSGLVYEHLLPARVRGWFGFHGTANPLLARFTEDEDTVFVNPLGDDAGFGFGALDLRDPADWQVAVR